MSNPQPWGAAGTDPVFTPKWLNPNDVKDWLRLTNPNDTSDDLTVNQCAVTTEDYVEDIRPEWMTGNGDYVPDSRTYRGAVMYAARLYRRRNSPAGIETFGDTTSFVSRWDPDIDRLLQIGTFAKPVVS